MFYIRIAGRLRPSASQMQRIDERKQAARGFMIEGNLALKAFFEQVRAVIMNAATAHIDGFDLSGRGVFQSLIIAFADHGIVTHDRLERGQRQHELMRIVRARHFENKAVFFERQTQRKSLIRRAFGQKFVAFDEVENGDLALMLDLIGGAGEALFVDVDADQGHGGIGSVEEVRILQIDMALRHVNLARATARPSLCEEPCGV